MLGSPATSTAAAAEAPAGTRTVRPSSSTAIVAAGPSGRGRNIEALGRELRQHRVERAGGDHRRKGIGVRPGERDATVAISSEGAGKLLGFIIDGQAIRRLHSQ